MAKKKVSKKPSGGDEPRYEDIVDRLEEIVEQIESGELDLEASIKGYEEGVGLLKRAKAILDRAEQRVEALDPAKDGGASSDS